MAATAARTARAASTVVFVIPTSEQHTEVSTDSASFLSASPQDSFTIQTAITLETEAAHAIASNSSDRRKTVALISGTCAGAALLGSLVVILSIFWCRRQKLKRRLEEVQSENTSEKFTTLVDPEAVSVPPPHTSQSHRKHRWVVRNRAASDTTLSSFSSPTVVDPVLEIAEVATSFSAYSQPTACGTA